VTFCGTLVILAQIYTDSNNKLNVETICLAVSDARCTKHAEYSIKCLIQVTRVAKQEVDWKSWRTEWRGKCVLAWQKGMSYLSHLCTWLRH